MSARHRAAFAPPPEHGLLPSLAALSLVPRGKPVGVGMKKRPFEEQEDDDDEEEDPRGKPVGVGMKKRPFEEQEDDDDEEEDEVGGVLDSFLKRKPLETEEQAPAGEPGNGFVAVVFEFDGVLTTGIEIVPGIKMLSSNLDEFMNMTPEEHVLNFGGEHVVKALDHLFHDMLNHEVQPIILSVEGYKQGIDAALSATELRQYFENGPEVDYEGKVIKELVEVFGVDVKPMNGDTPRHEIGVPDDKWHASDMVDFFIENLDATAGQMLYVGDPTVINAPYVGVGLIEDLKTFSMSRVLMARSTRTMFDVIQDIRKVLNLPEGTRGGSSSGAGSSSCSGSGSGA